MTEPQTPPDAPVEVKGPDGAIIRFPSGTHPDKIKEVMRRRYAAPKPPEAPQPPAEPATKPPAQQPAAPPFSGAPSPSSDSASPSAASPSDSVSAGPAGAGVDEFGDVLASAPPAPTAVDIAPLAQDALQQPQLPKLEKLADQNLSYFKQQGGMAGAEQRGKDLVSSNVADAKYSWMDRDRVERTKKSLSAERLALDKIGESLNNKVAQATQSEFLLEQSLEKLKKQAEQQPELAPELQQQYEGLVGEHNKKVRELQELSRIYSSYQRRIGIEEEAIQRRESEVNKGIGNFADLAWNNLVKGVSGALAAGPDVGIGLIMDAGEGLGILTPEERQYYEQPAVEKLAADKQAFERLVSDPASRILGLERVTPEYESQKSENPLIGGGLQLVRQAPALAAALYGNPNAAAAVYFAQGYDNAMQEMSTPEWADVPSGERRTLASVNAAIEGALEKFGASEMIGSSTVTKGIMRKVLGGLNPGMTPGQVSKLIDAETDSFLRNYLVSLAPRVLAEAGTEMETEIAQNAVKDIYEEAKSGQLGAGAQELFQNPETADGLWDNVKKAGLLGAIGAGYMGTLPAISEAIQGKRSFEQQTPRQFAMMEQILQDPEFVQSWKAEAELKVKQGLVKQSDVDKVLDDITVAQRAAEKLPDDLSPEKRRAAFDLLLKKDQLSKKDKSLVGPQIALIDDQLAKLAGNYEETPQAEAAPEAKTKPAEETTPQVAPQVTPQVEPPLSGIVVEPGKSVDLSTFSTIADDLPTKVVKAMSKEVSNIASSLGRAGVQVVVHATPESYAQAIADRDAADEGVETTGGVFFRGDNTIHINAREAAGFSEQGSVPYHEGFHAVMFKALGSTDAGNRIARDVAVAALKSSKDIPSELQQFLSRYEGYATKPDGTMDLGKMLATPELAHEVIAEFGARVADGSIKLTSAVRQWISDLYNRIMKGLGIAKAVSFDTDQDHVSALRDIANAMRVGRPLDIRSNAPQGEGAQFAKQQENPFDGAEEPKTPIGDTKTVVVDGKERSALNSEGRPIHPTLEGVRNFWRWFGDSEVVENPADTSRDFKESGNMPIVLYHGTGSDFDAFEVGREGSNSTILGSWPVRRFGMFFTRDSGIAASFAEQGKRPLASVMPVYLRISNPIDLTDGFRDDDIRTLSGIGVNEGFMYRVRADDIWGAFDDENDGEFFASSLKKAGFDGALITEVDPDTKEKSVAYVVFDPTQIKSATGNSGAFSPSDPRIQFAKNASRQEERLKAKLDKAKADNDELKAKITQQRIDAREKAKAAKEEFRTKLAEQAQTQRWKEAFKVAGEQIASNIQGQKQGRKDMAAEIKSMQDYVSGVVKGIVENMPYAMTKAQQDAMVRKASKIRSLNDLASFQDYADRVMEDADYRTKVDSGNNLRSKIGAALKTKQRTRLIGAEAVLATKDFLSLNPSKVDDIDTYLDLAGRLLDSTRGAKVTSDGDVIGAELSVTQKELTDFVSEEKQIMRDDAHDKLVENYAQLMEQFPDLAKDLTIEELDKLLSDAEKETDSQAAQALQERKLDALRKYTDIKLGLWNPKAAWGDTHTFSHEDQKAVDAIRRAPVQDLSAQELLKINAVATALETNGDMSDLRNAESIVTSHERAKAIAESEIPAKLNKDFNRLANMISNAAGNFEHMTNGAVKMAAELRRITGFDNMLNETAASHARTKKWHDDIFSMMKTLGIKPKEDTRENRTLMSVYAKTQEHYGGDKVDRQRDFEDAKKEVETDIAILTKHEGALDKKMRNQKIALEKAYDVLLRGANSAAEVAERFQKHDPRFKKLADWTTAEFDQRIRKKHFDSALKDNNLSPEPIYNYTHRSWKNVDGTPTQEYVDDILNIKARYFGRSGANTSPVGSKKDRQGRPKDRIAVQNYDFLDTSITAFEESDWDSSTAHERNIMSKLLRNTEFQAAMGPHYATFQDLVKGAVANYRGGAAQTSASFMAVTKFLNRLARLGAIRALASPAQAAKQATPLISASIMLGKDAPLLFKDIPNADKLHNQFMIGSRKDTSAGYQKLREKISAGTAVESTDGIVNQAVKQAGDILGELQSKPMEWWIASIDAAVASRSWNGFYLKGLKDQGIDINSRDLENEWRNPDQKAAAYANQMVERFQGANMSETMADVYKSKDTRVLAQIFMPFGSFALNQRTRIYRDFNGLFKGDTEDRLFALQSLVASVIESLVFNTMRAGLGYVTTAGGYYISDLLLGAAPGGDDEEERRLARKKDQFVHKVAYNTIKDMVYGGMPVPIDAVITDAVNKYMFSKDPYYVDERGRKVPNRPIFYSPESTGNAASDYASYFGVYGVGVGSLIDIWNKSTMLFKDQNLVVGAVKDGEPDRMGKAPSSGMDIEQWKALQEAGSINEGDPIVVEAQGNTKVDDAYAIAASLGIDLFSVIGLSVAEVNNINRQFFREIEHQRDVKLGSTKEYVVPPSPMGRRSK